MPEQSQIDKLIDNYARVIEQRDKLLAALSDLVDACECWDDQDDPVLVAAREAMCPAVEVPPNARFDDVQGPCP